MYSTTALSTFLAITSLLPIATGLGINCRGSGMCPLASWQNKSRARITQVLRDAVWNTPKSNDTMYGNGEHVICVSQFMSLSLTNEFTEGASVEGVSREQSSSFGLSGVIGNGGICLFPQHMAEGATLCLGSIRQLTDEIVEHGCSTCGSVPIHYVDQGSNDPRWGILTYNYVKNPSCTGNCLSANGQPLTNGIVPSSGTQYSRLKRSAKVGERIGAELVEEE